MFQTRRPHRFFGLLAALLLFGCGKQGEGERCDPANASLDCELGLVCRDYNDLGLSAEGDLRGAALCCPPADGPEPTVDVCRGQPTLPEEQTPPEEPEPQSDAGPTPPADAGQPSPSADAGGDAG